MLVAALLVAGTIGVVWMEHAAVLRAGGYTPLRFWRECFAEFSRTRHMIDGKKKITVRKMYSHVDM